jgi:hypothetical protein
MGDSPGHRRGGGAAASGDGVFHVIDVEIVLNPARKLGCAAK